jgi:hypothetical protein
VARRKQLFSKRHMTHRLEFVKRHILWSDETDWTFWPEC